MTRRIHVLTDGFCAPNAQALVIPLIRHRKDLRRSGFEIRLFDKISEELTDCDRLLVDARFFSGVEEGKASYMLSHLGLMMSKCPDLVWCDTTDSSSFIHKEILPAVPAYLKNQMLRDRNEYLRPIYGRRLFADHYHRVEGISDATENEKDRTAQIEDPALLKKLVLGWNSSLADYSKFGLLRSRLYRRLNWRLFLSDQIPFSPVNGPRSNDLSLRMSFNYDRDTVAFQRRKVREILNHLVPTDRLKRGDYFRELAQTKFVFSPFGWGEINYRDYETFLSGGVLIKPDMDHMESWPNLFVRNVTYLPVEWSLEGLEAQIQHWLADYPTQKTVAIQAQETYLRFLVGADAGKLFADRFTTVMAEIDLLHSAE